MLRMSTITQIGFLTRLGLPAVTAAQRKSSWMTFQRASTWHHFDAEAKRVGKLEVNGLPDHATRMHVRAAKRNGGRISPHFKLSEFRCRALGHRHVKINGELVYRLEQFRAQRSPRGLAIVTGYRCQAYNSKVGGTPNSAHLAGDAVDPDPVAGELPAASARGFGFHGIGIRNGHIVHLDVQAGLAKDTVFIDA